MMMITVRDTWLDNRFLNMSDDDDDDDDNDDDHSKGHVTW